MAKTSAERLISLISVFRDMDERLLLPQIYTLLMVQKYDKDGLSLKELAEKAGVSHAAVFRYIEDLGKNHETGEGMGLVTSTRDPADRRRMVVKLTPKGHTWLERVHKLLGE
jgi:DNA-binding MarR family transcriptional regulator